MHTETGTALSKLLGFRRALAATADRMGFAVAARGTAPDHPRSPSEVSPGAHESAPPSSPRASPSTIMSTACTSTWVWPTSPPASGPSTGCAPGCRCWSRSERTRPCGRARTPGSRAGGPSSTGAGWSTAYRRASTTSPTTNPASPPSRRHARSAVGGPEESDAACSLEGRPVRCAASARGSAKTVFDNGGNSALGRLPGATMVTAAPAVARTAAHRMPAAPPPMTGTGAVPERG